MFRIRHYDRYIHPDYFRHGWLGRFIRLLNWIRWKLETFNQRLVLRYLCAESAVGKTRSGELLKKFQVDVRDEKIRKELTSPLAPVVTQEEMMLAETPTGAGTFLHQEQANGLLRPEPIDALAARYGGNERSRRYARGKLFMVAGTEFDPVEPEQNKRAES
jgi:hypothetical protein